MSEAIGTILVIAIVASLWFGRKALKQFFTGLEEDLNASQAQSAVDTSGKVQEANKALEELKAKYDNKLVSADDVIKEARGGK